MSSKRAEPVLYIHQQIVKLPEGNMQEKYHSKNLFADTGIDEILFPQDNNKEEVSETEGTIDVSSDRQDDPHTSEEMILEEALMKDISASISEDIILKEDQEKRKRDITRQGINLKRTPFNALSLKEKLHHLRMVPASVTKIRYQFVTGDRSYVGYCLSFKNSILSLLLSENNTELRIKEEDIVDIQIKGI